MIRRNILNSISAHNKKIGFNSEHRINTVDNNVLLLASTSSAIKTPGILIVFVR